MSEPDGFRKRLLIEYVLDTDVAQPGAEVAVSELGIDIAGFTVDQTPVTVTVTESRHGPLVMIRGSADRSAAVGSDARVVGVWLDKPATATDTIDDDAPESSNASDVAPEWSDPDVEGPERYLF